MINGGKELVWKHSDADAYGPTGPEFDSPQPTPCVPRTGTVPLPPPPPSVPTIPKKPPPPPPAPCRCTKLAAQIEPGSIAFYGPHVLGRMRLDFTVQWQLRCPAGKIGCKARFGLSRPEPAAQLKARFVPRDGTIECKGPCNKELTGEQDFTLFGGPLLDHKHRAGKTIEIKVTRFCRDRQLITPESFKLTFDSQGFVDKKKSQLVAKS